MWYRTFGLGAVLGLLIPLVGCDVDVRDEGELPDVDVQTEPGRMPDIDAEGPDVDVRTEERTVDVPDVDIETEERVIEVPDVDIDIPDEEDNELRETDPNDLE